MRFAGFLVHGIRGIASPIPGKILRLIPRSTFVMDRERIATMWLQVVTGKWSNFFECQRQLSNILDAVWKYTACPNTESVSTKYPDLSCWLLCVPSL